MNVLLKWVFRIGLVLLLILGLFVALNLTLVRNMVSYDFADITKTSGLATLQSVPGAADAFPIRENTQNAEKFAALETAAFEDQGQAVIVWHDDEIVFEKYAEGVSEQTRFVAFSMHKSIVGMVATKMVDEGLISLDEPISKYVPAFTGNGRERITFRSALTHQTGLERYSVAPPDWAALQLLMSHRIEKTALNTDLVGDPEIFDYGNVNYQVAGAGLRAALSDSLGLSYADYLADRIWQPLGAGDAQLWAESKKGAPRFYSGLQASARDWLRVGIMLANGGSFEGQTILSPSAFAELVRPVPQKPDYGLGVWLGAPGDGTREYGPSTPMSVVHSAPYLVDDVVFLDGFGGQRVYTSQSQNLVVVRHGNPSFTFDDARLFNLALAAVLATPHSVQARDEIVRASTGREIPVRIIEPDASCNCPTLLFSTGAFASPVRYDELLSGIASRGVRIIAPHHVDSEEYPGVEEYPPQDWTRLRMEDVTTVAEAYGLMADSAPDWVIGGHSFGAQIAQSIGVSSLQKAQGGPVRILALSPPGNTPMLQYEPLMSDLQLPMLVITGTEDTVEMMAPNWCDHLASHAASPDGQSRALVFEGADHYFGGFFGRLKERDPSAHDAALVAQSARFILGLQRAASPTNVDFIASGSDSVVGADINDLCPKRS